MVPAAGGYRRLENQLYRVEVHVPGAPATATYKWSRDNGSIVGELVSVHRPGSGATEPPSVRVHTQGRDPEEAFAGAALIELSNETRALHGQHGILLRVGSVEGDVIRLLDPLPDVATTATLTTVRRWDGTGSVVAGGWLLLEDGVQVEFAGGHHAGGDYWTIPARTFGATIEWPREGGGEAFVPPHGVEHRYCPLAIVDVDAAGLSVVSDCRPLFTPLVGQTHMSMAGGDGQEVTGTTAAGELELPRPISVAVVNGRRAVAGARVVFDVVDGGGRVGSPRATEREVPSGTNGVASVPWAVAAAATQHRARARLLDRDGVQIGAELFFNASVERPVSGGVCTVVAHPGDDLQAAVEELPAGGGELCLAAGTYDLPDPLHVTGRRRVVITGRGPSTVIRTGHETVVAVVDCDDVTVRSLRIEAGGMGGGPGEQETQGALTIRRCGAVLVRDCQLACPDATVRAQACLLVFGSSGELPAPIVVEGNRFEPGAAQVGVLAVTTRAVRIAGNHVRLADAEEAFRGPWVQGARKEIIGAMLNAIRKDQGDDTREIRLGESRMFNIGDKHPTSELWRQWEEVVTDDEMSVEGTEPMIEAFVNRVVHAKADNDPLEDVRAVAVDLATAMRYVGQGIVVGGEPQAVDIVDNIVEDAVQGIHVGARSGAEHLTSGDVRIVRNSIACSIPVGFARERHAVYVANADAVRVLETTATLARTGGDDGSESTAVDAIRIAGQLGRMAIVRDSLLSGFTIGVNFMPRYYDPYDTRPFGTQVWVVSHTLAPGAQYAVYSHSGEADIGTHNVA